MEPSGGVDQNVDGAPAIEDRLDHISYFLGAGNIGLKDQGRSPCRFDLCAYALCFCKIDVGYGNRSALTSKRLRDRLTQPLAGCGHDGRRSGKFACSCHLLFSPG